MVDHPPDDVYDIYRHCTRLESLFRDAEVIASRISDEMDWPSIPTQGGGVIHTSEISPYSPQYTDDLIRSFEKLARVCANGFYNHSNQLKRQLESRSR